jgi:predicted transcriptional regulator
MRTKDFGSLLQLLQLSQQNGLLLVMSSEGDWQARLQLQGGMPKSCYIALLPSMMVVMSGQKAIEWLSHRGELEWFLEESSSPPEKNTAVLKAHDMRSDQRHLTNTETFSSAFAKRVPHRLSHAIDQNWSREARRVFALIDGKRTIETIAELLRKRPEEMRPILQQLVSKGIIHISRTE